MSPRNIFLSFFLLSITTYTYCQSQSKLISRIELHSDSAMYSSDRNMVIKNGIKKTYFYYSSDQATFEVRVFSGNRSENIQLVPSRDFELIDSLIYLNPYTRFKIKFSNLTQSDLLRFTFKTGKDTIERFEEFQLQPITNTKIWLKPSDENLFIGEEKVYEVFSNNINNINFSNEWIVSNDLDYRFTKSKDELMLHIIPKRVGNISFSTELQVYKPFLTNDKELQYSLPPLEYVFNVKSSRLQFLSLDKSEISFCEETRKDGIEIQLENSRLLQMQKTYRLEAQEEAGGALIAEIFTKRRLANNKVLCIIRPYNFHRNSGGYLYIKDGDNPQFITNVNITPATQIEKISILQEGSEWKQTNRIYPGEVIDIKLEGQGLHKAKFHFEDLVDLTNDTLIKSEKEQVFKLKVPVDITKKKLNIYNYSDPTGHYLSVSEYQRPRELDFVYINYGDFARRVSGIKAPILYDQAINDITLSFNDSKIDNDKLYGKQYLSVKIQISDKNNQLIELKTLNNITICPSEDSPRSKYYKKKDCNTGDISLNKELRKPTYSLDGWSRINMIISHDKSKYGGEGHEKEIDIILKRRYSFDVEVSFPAGLLTFNPNDSTDLLGSMSSINMAVIAQFSFYHPDKINTFRPYKIGAGFLASNAFNLSEGSAELNLVVLGSLYPTTKDAKLSFPLYMGGGITISGDKPFNERYFFLIGPGIRVKF